MSNLAERPWARDAREADAEIERLRARVAKLEEALSGYRIATQWVASDSWDGCRDCMDMLRKARALDHEMLYLTPDDFAKALVDFRARAAL